MNTIYPPNQVPDDDIVKVFLAGSIEMGKAVDWQNNVIASLGDMQCTVLNSRRTDWDNSWKQDPNTNPFREQVIWEQWGILCSEVVFFNFCSGTQSPISLLELGQVLGRTYATIIVVCPKDFYRYGNVAITCELSKVPVYETLEAGIEKLKEVIEYKNYWRNQE